MPKWQTTGEEPAMTTRATMAVEERHQLHQRTRTWILTFSGHSTVLHTSSSFWKGLYLVNSIH